MNNAADMKRSTTYWRKLHVYFKIYIFIRAQYGCRELISDFFKLGLNCDSPRIFPRCVLCYFTNFADFKFQVNANNLTQYFIKFNLITIRFN
jgi:hypothetical protein